MPEQQAISAPKLTINGQRLWASLMEIAQIGATERGGVCRLTGTELDRQARDLFWRWCEEAGCTVTVDAVGNMFARRPGRNPDRAPVAIGSHLDSQPTGGKYDGAFGVIAGLEIVRTLNDLDIETDAPIEIINWTNEEGARFAPVMMGSGTFAGVYSVEQTRASRDADGVTFGEALDQMDYAGDAPMGMQHPLEVCLEAHIEQGPILEQEGVNVGIVTDAQGIAWYDITVRGEEGHAGTTPMDARRDALTAAAGLITAINQIAREHGPAARITVGDLELAPGSRNTIPGRVRLLVDMRDPDMNTLQRMDDLLRQAADREADNHRVEVTVDRISRTAPVRFDSAVVDAMGRAADAAGISHREMLSGAGHDVCHIAGIAPAGLLFVPCKDGISHNEAESATPEDLAAGCEVLYRVALEKAGQGR